jgi:hypothetical protein
MARGRTTPSLRWRRRGGDDANLLEVIESVRRGWVPSVVGSRNHSRLQKQVSATAGIDSAVSGSVGSPLALPLVPGLYSVIDVVLRTTRCTR